MSARQPRWELVRTAAGWHARFRSSNGNIIVSSEVYKYRRGAVRAIELTTRGSIWGNRNVVQPDAGCRVVELDER